MQCITRGKQGHGLYRRQAATQERQGHLVRRQEEKGRTSRRHAQYQEKDPAHILASERKRCRHGNWQLVLYISRQGVLAKCLRSCLAMNGDEERKCSVTFCSPRDVYIYALGKSNVILACKMQFK